MHPSLGDEIRNFARNHKLLSICTLGIAIAGYSIGKLMGRIVAHIRTPSGSTEKIQNTAAPVIQNLSTNKQFNYIDWAKADDNIKRQMAEMWPARAQQFAEAPSSKDKILCMIEGTQLVGCVALEDYTLEEPPSFVDRAGGKPVFKLDIEIVHSYKGKGHGRQLFEKACKSIIKDGGLVYLVDATDGTGDSLYGGEKTRSQFDVSFHLLGKKGEYLLGKKEAATKPMQYLKIDPNKTFIFWTALESPEGMCHLANYFTTYPKDKEIINEKFLESCEKRLKMNEGFWTQEQKKSYAASLAILRALP